MQYNSRWAVAVVVMAALSLVGCSEAVVKEVKSTPATVKKMDGGINRITLVESSTKRLGIEFVEVKSQGGKLEAPYDVVVYDNFGKEWVYTSPEPNVFTRTPIKIDSVVGDTLYFSEGPPAGTKMVISGAAELLGIEAGVGQ